MNSQRVKFITRTGMLLALTVVFQYLGRYIPLGPNSNFVVGPLVNACLIIASGTVGLVSGIIISIIAPYMAVLTNHSPMAPFLLTFTPFIAAGNFILVLFAYVFRNRKIYLGIGIGAVMKFLFLFASISLFTTLVKIPAAMAATLNFLFSWPQLITSVSGGIIAVIVIKALPKNNKI